jgi:5'-3' exonuclease, N-terminal resolvase-like domain
MSQPNLFDEPERKDAPGSDDANVNAAGVTDESNASLGQQVSSEHVLDETESDERGIPPESEALDVPQRAPKSDGVTPNRVVLIDGHALAYRSYFALSRGPTTMQTSKGEPTQAIFGFMKTLMKLLRDGAYSGKKKLPIMGLRDAREHAVIVVFDPPVKTFRHEAFAEYKAGRAQTPDDLPDQIRKIKKLVDLMGLVRLEVNGYEADDVIGTLARQAEEAGCEVRILTSDRDAYQLLSDRVRVISTITPRSPPPM